MTLRKALLVITAIILIGLWYSYCTYLMWPSSIDFYFRGKQYQTIADIILMPQVRNSFHIANGEAKLNGSSICWDKLCQERLSELTQVVSDTYLLDARLRNDWKVILTRYGDPIFEMWVNYIYIYSKEGFTQKEKTDANVVKLLNDNWLIAREYFF